MILETRDCAPFLFKHVPEPLDKLYKHVKLFHFKYLFAHHLFAGTEENYENTVSTATTRAKILTSVVLEYETEALTTRQ